MAKLPLRTFNTLKADYIRGGTFSAATMIVGAEGMIRSSNYVAGSAGWMIDGDGNAEFNNVTIRGTIYATAGEITGTLTIATGGKIVMPLVDDFEMWIQAGGIEIKDVVIDYIAAAIFMDTSGNIVFAGDASANEADFLDFPSGIYIGPSANAVPQMTGIVIEHSGTPSSSDTSILVRGDKFGTPQVLFMLNGNGRANFHDGSASLPSISFYNDQNTGIYRSAADTLAFTAGGVLRGEFGTFGLALYNGGSLYASDGTAAAPAIRFLGDQNTGFYRPASDQINVTCGATPVVGMSTAEINCVPQIKSGGVYNATTGSAANMHIASTGLMYRSTSSRRYKDQITQALNLADIDLTPVRFWSLTDERWQYGFVAEDVAAVLPEAAELNEAGEVENYDLRAVVAVLAAKVARLEKELALR
jgi:hypothetical protein